MEGVFEIIKIDTIEAYYILTAKDTLNRAVRILSLKKSEECDSSFVKVKLGEKYYLELVRMVTMYIDENKSESILFPDRDFYIDDIFISSPFNKPFESINLKGLFYIPVKKCIRFKRCRPV